jgi:uncharacterized protein YcbK (DUF882 family)
LGWIDATFPGSLRFGSMPGHRRAATVVLTILASALGIRGTQNAVANGDTRTITIQHMHTKEETTVTFKQDGRYVSSALEKLNWALRDWRSDEPIRMDPRLFDVVWEVQRQLGSEQPFHVVSAYRSPNTNAMLRRRSRAVAKHSQHMLGKAMDFYLPDVPTARIREIGMRLQRGGVGFYPNAHTPFVHLDVGSVRSWPRMTRDQLVRLFPDQKTVHIPADGQPLAGYELARAEIMAGGGSVGGYAVADADEGAVQASGRKSLWAMLFGGDEEEADARPAQQRRGAPPQPTVMAYANRRDDSTSDSAGRFLVSAAAPEPSTRAITRDRSQRLAPQAQPQAEQDEAPVATPAIAAAAPQPAPEPARRAQLIDAPLPLARPRDLAPSGIDGTQIAALPAGAGALAFAQTGPGADQRLVLASLPPRRPDEMTASINPVLAGPTVAAPLPPARPGELMGVAVAALRGTDPGEVPESVEGRLVRISHPLPPARPRDGGAAFATATEQSAPVPASTRVPLDEPQGMDRVGLESLFTTVARPHAAPAAGRPVNVATARARSDKSSFAPIAGPSPAASLGFSQADPVDAKPGRFSGPAVRPLPTNFVQN